MRCTLFILRIFFSYPACLHPVSLHFFVAFACNVVVLIICVSSCLFHLLLDGCCCVRFIITVLLFVVASAFFTLPLRLVLHAPPLKHAFEHLHLDSLQILPHRCLTRAWLVNVSVDCVVRFAILSLCASTYCGIAFVATHCHTQQVNILPARL